MMTNMTKWKEEKMEIQISISKTTLLPLHAMLLFKCVLFAFYLFVLFFSFLFPGPILKDLKYLQFLTNICNGFQSISTAAMP